MNVAPASMAEPAAVSETNAGPSGSVAVTVNARSEPSETEAVAGAVTTGRTPHDTEIAVDAEPLRVFTAVNVTPNVPDVAGVQENVPDVLLTFEVNVPPAVMAVPLAVSPVTASPSGSPA